MQVVLLTIVCVVLVCVGDGGGMDECGVFPDLGGGLLGRSIGLLSSG